MAGDAEEAARGLAEHHGLRYVDLSRAAFSPAAASYLPEETARRYRAVPIERDRGTTVVALADPADPLVMGALTAGVEGEVVTVVAPLDQVTAAIARLYGGGAARSGRRRGEHVADQEAVEPTRRDPTAYPTARFATADALLAAASGSTDDDQAVADRAPSRRDEQGGAPSEAAARAGAQAEPRPTGEQGAAPATNGHARATSDRQPDGHGDGHGSVNGANGANGYGRANRPGAEATSDAGAGHGSAPPAANGRAEAPANAAAPSSLEESLREVLAPPEIDHRVPPWVPPSLVPAPSTEQDLSKGDGGTPYARGATSPVSTPAAPATPTGNNGTAATAPPAPTAPPTAPSSAASAPSSAPAGSAAPAAVAVATEVPAPPPPPPGYGAIGDGRPPGADLHWPPLARVLVTSGRVSYDEMVRALRAHKDSGESLARYLYNQQMATEDDLVQAMAEEVGLEFVDLSAFPVDAQAASLIPDAVARRHMVLPIKVEHGVPIVAMANPTDVFAMDDLRSIMGRNFTPVVATRSQISSHLRMLQESDGDVEEAAQSAAGIMAPGTGGGFELESLQSVVEDAPIVRYVNLLILQALNERASDIHIEPTPKRLRIRFRIDGVMHDASSASPAIHSSVVSRLKVLGEMDITEHRIPQEGRVSVSVGDRQIDLRLATLPTLYGETCVMRLLDKSASIRRLSELGFLPDTAERYAQAYHHPYGVILVTGPTGAGKTTTLYATLQEVMSKEKSVVTVEDPVEYQIDGINQVQINPKVGLQFSTALRSILRADPDIILVGEIRDMETATIAMEAALSGHLVLSTLHTNTAAATPLRLTEMGIEPFLVTSAVGGVLTQRLARVLCERCKTPYDASATDFYAAGYKEPDLEGLDISTLHRANGCRSCSHTGYHGRMVLAEVMPITEEIERMIIEQQSIVAMERQAVDQGMRTLRQDGLIKALTGQTTLEEVLRVVV